MLMNRILPTCFAIGILLISGCSVTPVINEFTLPPQVAGQEATEPGMTRVVIFNASNSAMYGADGSGKLNVLIDQRGVGRLSIGEFVVVDLPSGRHSFDLSHKDVFTMQSSKVLDVQGKLAYVKINATVTSNEATLVPPPSGFDKSFRPMGSQLPKK